MRQGQQNRRGRGRNRKGHQNPLTRSFESNGPDVKLRGTPSHIAEKYISLARDAQSSGDPVLAENYLQHAEHYNRIIMAVREQQIAQGGGDPMAGGMGRQRPGVPGMPGDAMDGDDYGDDEGDDFDVMAVRGAEPQPQVQMQPQGQPQPRLYDRPQRNEPRGERQHDRPDRMDRGDRRHERHGRDRFEGRGPQQHRDREPRENREFRERPPVQEGRGGYAERSPAPMEPREPREQQREPREPQAGAPDRGDSRRRERFGSQPMNDQPDFLRRPLRRPRRDSNGEGEAAAVQPAPVATADEGGRE